MFETFRSLNVLVAENCTEIGKNAEGSAGGTTNSIDPLPTIHSRYGEVINLELKSATERIQNIVCVITKPAV